MENQEFEWKTSWHDEYLKTICGFANAHGGSIVIGKDDNGKVVGVANARKLLEDLPNKIINAMAIVSDVQMQMDDGVQFITVNVNPYPFPISYRGKYYYRSGSTTQTLTGNALDAFMLKKQGKTWDGVPVPNVKVSDLDVIAFRDFRKKALSSRRLSAEDLSLSDEELIDNLLLSEGNYLKRAAVLLFHEKPEIWVTGAYVKIGYFTSESDLSFQNEIHGSIITMPDKIMEIIYGKYLKGLVSYEGIQRIETYPVPEIALREALINAIVHRDYSSGVPIQIKIFPDEVIIYNDGSLAENWTVDDLFVRHRSKPYNPNIANTFFRSGMIETWGRGIEKIIASCRSNNNTIPKIDVSKSEFNISFPIFSSNISIEEGVKRKNKIKVIKTKMRTNILEIMRLEPTITIKAISMRIGISLRNTEKNIHVLQKYGMVERIGGIKNGYWKVID